MKHLFSESAVWKTISEFVSPDGKITHAEGESVISVQETVIMNESWAILNNTKRVNNYRITSISPYEFIFDSSNPELGKQTGVFHIDRDRVFSKFKIVETTLNGFEIVRRENDVCFVQGALYDNDTLINTWSATMHKIT